MARKKKIKKGIALKIGLLTVLAGAITSSAIRRILYGDPPSKLRKRIIYGVLASMMIYRAYADDVKQYFSNLDQKIYDSTVLSLQEQVEDYKDRYQTSRREVDSLRGIVAPHYLTEGPADITYWYPVQRGETINSIATKFRVSRRHIRSNNRIQGEVEVGFPLKIKAYHEEAMNMNIYPHEAVRSSNGDNFSEFLRRTCEEGDALFNQVVRYNRERNNTLIDLEISDLRSQIIYLPPECTRK